MYKQTAYSGLVTMSTEAVCIVRFGVNTSPRFLNEFEDADEIQILCYKIFQCNHQRFVFTRNSSLFRVIKGHAVVCLIAMLEYANI